MLLLLVLACATLELGGVQEGKKKECKNPKMNEARWQRERTSENRRDPGDT